MLTGELPEDEFQFHATAIYATGGMVLSGDDLTKIPEPRLAMLKKLLPPTGVAAEFDDEQPARRHGDAAGQADALSASTGPTRPSR